ncbi:MAG: UDP-N-acetylglucosamine 2-epimerase (hydrolyzing) [Gammaproteobacteria bacterium]|nr:UDP-N-acetylglucosamine 2-epimerase (hydrolyzing) [Gammaproteobacteria bacterium]
MIKIGFFTGARSEYSSAKEILNTLDCHPNFELSVYPSGMHLLSRFGDTLKEIADDGFHIGRVFHTYSEENEDKGLDFKNSFEQYYKYLKESDLDVIFVIGDRIEAYSAALAAHFAGIKIAHSGGGHITAGAVDDIYRFGISSMAEVNFATSRKAFERLLELPYLDKQNVFFTGSISVDQIKNFLENPVAFNSIALRDSCNPYALVTFHPTTKKLEPILDIIDIVVSTLQRLGVDIVFTYPNNDDGSFEIIEKIQSFSHHEGIWCYKSLGARGYYAAINDSSLVIGNSSSGLSEAPYFHKKVINVGSRQEGRELDPSIVTVPASEEDVIKAIENAILHAGSVDCAELYGSGDSVNQIVDILLSHFDDFPKQI